MLDTTRPASRILAMLELLQESPGITGPDLAERLDVTPRTVRRYMVTLQDMGIPVESNVGRSGGYALAKGFRLPPLMFSADEALGLAMALLATEASGYEQLPDPVARALAKIERVLPTELSERVKTVRSEVAFLRADSWRDPSFPEPMVLATLAQARLARQRVWFRYGRPTGDESAREVDPYGIGNVSGRWYLHGYCHLRQATRTFRVDRIRRVDVLPASFEMPDGLDVISAIEQSLAMSWQEWQIEIIVHAPIDHVADAIPRQMAVLEELPDDRTRLKASTSNLQWFGSRILFMPYVMEIISPPELREVASDHAARLQAIARD